MGRNTNGQQITGMGQVHGMAATTTLNGSARTITLPGSRDRLSLELPAGLAALREEARRLQAGDRLSCVEIPVIDAQTWETRSAEEDWLIWRARRSAARLRRMPLDLEPEELVVGKPLLRMPSEGEQERLERAQGVLNSMPPYPGGDAGHFHPDYETLFRLGIGGILCRIEELAGRDGLSAEQETFYETCRIAMEGMSAYVRRVGGACDDAAEDDPEHADRWRETGRLCRRLATEPPRTFSGALQLMFCAQIALWFGDDHYLTSPGRVDQTLRRFYEADLAAGRLTRREALEMLCALYIQMNRILWPGSAVAVMVGGRDAQGRDVTNDLTYLALAARLATGLVYPTVGLAWHEETPAELTDFAVELLGTGLGDPAFFNDELIAQGLRDQGVTPADSYNYMNSTCVEIKVAGASNIWVTAPYYNLPGALLDVMEEAVTGGRPEPAAFGELVDRVKQHLDGQLGEAAARLDRIWRERGRRACFPLASCVVRDCLERGRDFDRGGARYNWVENSFVGLANLVDSLVAVKKLVYETAELSLSELYDILKSNFEGQEALRQRIVNSLPTYGNDKDEPDALARELAEFLIRSTASRMVGPHQYVPGFFCWVQHERLGSETGATPDGRRAGLPLADGAGAAQGRDTRGPTASVLSTTKWTHRPVLGGLVHNVKFSGSMFETAQEREAVRGIIETYMRRGGFEIQVNVVSREELLDAQEHPEGHRDLLVRVAGYSDYFVHLNRNMQNEIIAREEHRSA